MSERGDRDVVIRRSNGRDQRALARLAQRDSAPPPSGPHLVVEEGGQLRAAVPLAGGAVIADPFHRTAELVALLDLRARQLPPAGERPAPRGLRLRARRTATDGGLAFAAWPPRR